MTNNNMTNNDNMTNNNMTPACRGILGFQSKLPRDVAIAIECIAHKHRCNVEDIATIEQARKTLDYMQSSPKMYYNNSEQVVESRSRVAKLLSGIHNKELLTNETSITTYGGRGHKYLYTWSLVGKTTNMVITSTGGIQKCSICNTLPMSTELECTLDMDNWDGSIPGECPDGVSISLGWFNAPINYLDTLKKNLIDNLNK